MTDKMPDLLPCPFCGDQPRSFHDKSSDYEAHWSWSVVCECGGEVNHEFDTEKEAIECWNTRTPADLQALKERVMKEVENELSKYDIPLLATIKAQQAINKAWEGME